MPERDLGPTLLLMAVRVVIDEARVRRGLEASRPTLVAVGLAVATLAWTLVTLVADPSFGFLASGQDARSYYGLHPDDPYADRSAWGTVGAYPYSPAFAQLVWPLGLLPWPLFVAAWTAILLACLAWLTGRELLVAGVCVAAAELLGGNISLLLAVAIVLGFRWPAAWSFVLLTKVTPGIGLLWFLVRREWRPLAIALGATVAVVAASYLLAPAAWPAWIEYLRTNTGRAGTWAAVPVPLAFRLPLGVALVTWGARNGQRWTVPVAAMLALPALWYGSLAMLLAVIPLTSPSERQQAAAALGRWVANLAAGLRHA
jgi:hypothetical protein